MPQPRTFEEFWPYYVGEHRHPTTRMLHMIGSHAGIVAVALGFAISPWWFAAALPLGYSFAWFGHFYYEKNHPATFTYPLWSFRGDLRMLRLTWMGRMDAEVARLTTARAS
jgi:hypothetical protein